MRGPVASRSSIVGNGRIVALSDHEKGEPATFRGPFTQKRWRSGGVHPRWEIELALGGQLF